MHKDCGPDEVKWRSFAWLFSEEFRVVLRSAAVKRWTEEKLAFVAHIRNFQSASWRIVAIPVVTRTHDRSPNDMGHVRAASACLWICGSGRFAFNLYASCVWIDQKTVVAANYTNWMVDEWTTMRTMRRPTKYWQNKTICSEPTVVKWNSYFHCGFRLLLWHADESTYVVIIFILIAGSHCFIVENRNEIPWDPTEIEGERQTEMMPIAVIGH